MHSLAASLGFAAAVLVGFSAAQAAAKSQAVKYKQGQTDLQGYLVYDDANQGKRPGVLVVPEWWGLNDYARRRANELAAMGYVALAVDMYGNGVTANTPDDAKKLAMPLLQDRQLMRSRITAALELLRANEMVDTKRIAAIGYCFGGTTVLELARSGADVAGVVSFHGNLSAPAAADAGAIKCKVLVLTGADDPMVPPDAVAGFENEMRKAGADYYVTSYGGAVHAFSNPDADKAHMPGVGYNEKADKRSWQAMKDFFGEIFGKMP